MGSSSVAGADRELDDRKTATGKSTDVTFTPTTAGQPQQFQIRVQLKRNNVNYGQLSDIISVTVSP